jgi:hypothetical protein
MLQHRNWSHVQALAGNAKVCRAAGTAQGYFREAFQGYKTSSKGFVKGSAWL